MRIRTLKPEFWQHEEMSSLPPLTRLLAIGLLNWADDAGFFLASPALIRGSLLPFEDDSKIIPGMLDDLSKIGWIRIGIDDQGRAIGQIINFSKHQRVDKPQKSKIEPVARFLEDSRNDPGTIPEGSRLERKGKEQGTGNGKGKEHECARDSISWADEILGHYRRRENMEAAKLILVEHIEEGDPPEQILAGTKAMGAAYSALPSGWLNIHVPAATTFFRNKRWKDDPGTVRNKGPNGNGSKPGTGGLTKGTANEGRAWMYRNQGVKIDPNAEIEF